MIYRYNPFCIYNTCSSFPTPSKKWTDMCKLKQLGIELSAVLFTDGSLVPYPKSYIMVGRPARSRVWGSWRSPRSQHTCCAPFPQPLGPTEVKCKMSWPHPYLSQAGVLVHVLAFLHAGSQLLQDTPAACQRSGQPSKLSPAWSIRKRKETSSATFWRYTNRTFTPQVTLSEADTAGLPELSVITMKHCCSEKHRVVQICAAFPCTLTVSSL